MRSTRALLQPATEQHQRDEDVEGVEVRASRCVREVRVGRPGEGEGDAERDRQVQVQHSLPASPATRSGRRPSRPPPTASAPRPKLSAVNRREDRPTVQARVEGDCEDHRVHRDGRADAETPEQVARRAGRAFDGRARRGIRSARRAATKRADVEVGTRRPYPPAPAPGSRSTRSPPGCAGRAPRRARRTRRSAAPARRSVARAWSSQPRMRSSTASSHLASRRPACVSATGMPREPRRS